MARKKRLWTPEIVRQRIRTSMLLNRVQNHIVDHKKTPMRASQLKGALFLLSRVVGVPNEPQDLNLNGNVTMVFDDPTKIPDGYQRKPLDHG